MVLLIDNYDSFTYMLRDYILQALEECIVVRNDEMDMPAIEQLTFDSIVISPGPKSPNEAGITMDIIKAFYDRKPILGICLGHQAIGQFFGAELIKADRPMHGKTSQIRHYDHPIFDGIADQIDVMRYHSLILKDMPDALQVIAETTHLTSSGHSAIMALTHRDHKIAGLQFHPESVLSTDGLQMIKNWFTYIR